MTFPRQARSRSPGTALAGFAAAGQGRTIARGWLRAGMLGAGLALALQAAVAAAQPAAAAPGAAPSTPTADCTAVANAPVVAVRSGTYVALGRDILLRLLVEQSLESAVLVVNRVDGNQLYDRRYWKPVRSAEHCGVRRVEYGDDAVRNAAAPPGESGKPPLQRLRLLLLPPEAIAQPGLPQPMIFFRAVLEVPGTAPMPLEFEEVVVKREISAG